MTDNSTVAQTKALNKNELALAQYLYGASVKGSEWADKIDPDRDKKIRAKAKRKFPRASTEMLVSLDAVARQAENAFFHLTGRFSHQIAGEWELSTVRPAEWTKSVPVR